MSQLDLILRGGTVVTATELLCADVGVAEGRIVAFAPELAQSAHAEIDADGLHLFPGVIDAHVHFNEPGRTRWEGFATGSRALAAGGGTLFFDMPLNASPPTLDAESFDRKHAAARASSITDFAFWGGLTPLNLDRLGELHERGVIGFKAFMCSSGIEDFPCADPGTLREGMKRAAALGAIVAVHAEDEALTQRLAAERLAHGLTTARDFLDSRPVEAELEAIRVAVELAGETGCALHVVHVSCGEGAALVDEAARRGADVTCETCPHYLTLTDEDLLELGAVAKCAPPLRPALAQEQLWQRLFGGSIQFVASDHSPCPPEMKESTDFFRVWGGIAGAQRTLPLLLQEGHVQRGLSLPAIHRLLSLNVATRFRLPAAKGGLKVGGDADLAVVDLNGRTAVDPATALHRHPLTAYDGMCPQGLVVHTLVRGVPVSFEGEIVSQPAGRLVKPVPAA